VKGTGTPCTRILGCSGAAKVADFAGQTISGLISRKVHSLPRKNRSSSTFIPSLETNGPEWPHRYIYIYIYIFTSKCLLKLFGLVSLFFFGLFSCHHRFSSLMRLIHLFTQPFSFSGFGSEYPLVCNLFHFDFIIWSCCLMAWIFSTILVVDMICMFFSSSLFFLFYFSDSYLVEIC